MITEPSHHSDDTTFAGPQHALLQDIDRLLADSTLRPFYDFALESAVRLTDSAFGYLAFADKAGTLLTMYAWSEDVLELCAVADRTFAYPLARTGLWGDPVRERRPIIVNDYAAEPTRSGLPEGHVPILRHLGVPLVRFGRVVATLGVANKDRAYDVEDIRQVSLLLDALWQTVAYRSIEHAHQETEDRLRLLAANAQDVIFRYRLGPNPGFEYLSPAVQSVTGHTPEEYYENPGLVTTLIPAEELSVWQTTMRTTTLEPYCVEYGLQGPGGAAMWIEQKANPVYDAGGLPVAIEGIARDVTARRATLEALRASTQATARSEMMLRGLVEQSSSGVILVDENDIIVEWNQAQEVITGLSRSETIGQPAGRVRSRVLPPGPGNHPLLTRADRVRDAVHSAGSSASPQHEREVLILRPDGELRTVEVAFFPISLPDGTMYAGIFRDVTERKQQDEHMRSMQKLESIGLLAGGIAHDFNNLLTSTLGQATLALARLESDHPAREHIRKAVRATEQAAALTRQLLAYAGKGQFKIEPLDLNIVVRQNAALIEASLTSEVPVRLDLAPGPLVVDADGAQMQQLVMNLIINAAEAVQARQHRGDPSPGLVLVQTAGETLTEADLAAGWVSMAVPEPGPVACLTVSDDGIGMDRATLNRIFDPFFTTKSSGRGLGLAAILGIVRGHSGGIQVTSRPGEGTVFKVVFALKESVGVSEPTRTAPLSAAGPRCPSRDHSRPAHAGAQSPGERPVRTGVLVIDDEGPVREALTDILELAGIPSLTAATGQQGLDCYAQNRDVIGLVILDLLMPVLSGEKTLLALRQIDVDLPVLLSSGYDESEAARRFADRSIAEKPSDFLQKPYTIETVIEKVQALLGARA